MDLPALDPARRLTIRRALSAALTAACALHLSTGLAAADTRGPDTRIVTPGAAAEVTGVVRVKVTAVDLDGVDRVVIFDGARSVGVIKSLPYEANWNTADGPDGARELRVLAFDRRGNRTVVRQEVVVGAAKLPLWNGDLAGGDLAQWQQRFTKVYSVAPDRIAVVPSPSGDGAPAGRYTVRRGDKPVANGGDRAEVALTDPTVNGVLPGDAARYYAWETFIPVDYAASRGWQTLAQWHQSKIAGPSPLKIALQRNSTLFELHGRTTPGEAPSVLFSTPATRGVWHSFVLGVKWSGNADKGWIELWHGGQQVLPRTYRATQYLAANGLPVPNHFKQGLYRDPAITAEQTLYHRGTRIGVSYDSVAGVR